ncbi:MAG: metalloregulator ArsR/SmtB family transcription factor [Bacteroidota bacterium]
MESRFHIPFLETSTEVLRAIAHPIRIAIIDLLKDGKLSVTEIHKRLKIEQAIASHHLRILKDKRVLSAQRDGKNTFYSLRSEEFADILSSLESLLS